MSIYNFLTWKKRDEVLYAYPADSRWIYAIYSLADTKQFELVLIDNYDSNNNKLTSVYASLEKAIFAAQAHFNNMIVGDRTSPS